MERRISEIIRYMLYTVVFLIFIIPGYWVFLTAVKPSTELFTIPPKWFTLRPGIENFITIITRTSIPIGFRNSIIISFSSVLITTFLSSLAAYGFSRFSFRWKNTALVGLLVIKMLPLSLLVVSLYVVIGNYGMLDRYPGLVAVYVAFNIPYSVWIIKAFFDSIPKEIDEAAEIDGCNNIQTFLKIILPLTVPGLIASATITFFSCWNEFIVSYTLTSSANVQPLSIGLYSFMAKDQGIGWGAMSAASVIAILPPALFFLMFQKYFIAGMTGGSIKE